MPRRSSLPLPDDYAQVLETLKAEIRTTRTTAQLAANEALISLYWRIGRAILGRQEAEGWGAKVIERLAADLGAEFPEMTGLSRRNLFYMRDFAGAWPEIVPRPVAQLPWSSVRTLLDKLDDADQREWYARQARINGWSRDFLAHQIQSGLHTRQGAAPSNFELTVPAEDTDLVRQMVKDPYKLEFLGIGAEASERELENALINQLERFLLELGHGFAFVGRQYHLEVGGDDFYIDLLFYNIPLHRYVVVELKIGKFEPEFVSKLNFYVNAIDRQVRGAGDNPTIGLLLCAERNDTVVGYTLGGVGTPMAVANYETLPAEVRKELPAAEELEQVVDKATRGVQLTIADYLDRLAAEGDESDD